MAPVNNDRHVIYFDADDSILQFFDETKNYLRFIINKSEEKKDNDGNNWEFFSFIFIFLIFIVSLAILVILVYKFCKKEKSKAPDNQRKEAEIRSLPQTCNHQPRTGVVKPSSQNQVPPINNNSTPTVMDPKVDNSTQVETKKKKITYVSRTVDAQSSFPTMKQQQPPLEHYV